MLHLDLNLSNNIDVWLTLLQSLVISKIYGKIIIYKNFNFVSINNIPGKYWYTLEIIKPVCTPVFRIRIRMDSGFFADPNFKNPRVSYFDIINNLMGST